MASAAGLVRILLDFARQGRHGRCEAGFCFGAPPRQRGLTMPDRFNEKRGKVTKAMSQVEIDAQRIREKTARLRELRLAQEAANASAAARAPVRSAPAKKKQARKPGEKGPSLSDWLDTQQSQGRRG
jgi:hypothetical protein